MLKAIKNVNTHFQIQNRRYIGDKYKLNSWIFESIKKECVGSSFIDLFAGTGVVSAEACKFFESVIINDFLYSNNIIYKAFFWNREVGQNKLSQFIDYYNALPTESIGPNYFSDNFGGKYFSHDTAKKIGFIRQDIESSKEQKKINEAEYYQLLTVLIYGLDKIANTVGHFEAFFQKKKITDCLILKPLIQINSKKTIIYKEDANILAKKIKADIAYIDPPYNSRQYSRFYHLLETLVKWDKPKLYGIALKPPTENVSEYCKTSAKFRLKELIDDLDAKFIVVSYNNTYLSKSGSSKNKISLEEIELILKSKGKTKIKKRSYKYFNSGNTKFKDHLEYLFITKVQ